MSFFFFLPFSFSVHFLFLFSLFFFLFCSHVFFSVIFSSFLWGRPGPLHDNDNNNDNDNDDTTSPPGPSFPWLSCLVFHTVRHPSALCQFLARTPVGRVGCCGDPGPRRPRTSSRQSRTCRANLTSLHHTTVEFRREFWSCQVSMLLAPVRRTLVWPVFPHPCRDLDGGLRWTSHWEKRASTTWVPAHPLSTASSGRRSTGELHHFQEHLRPPFPVPDTGFFVRMGRYPICLVPSPLCLHVLSVFPVFLLKY